jgi:hypothetical protein
VWIPLALEVAEVNSGLEHLLECCLFHVYFPGLSNPMVAAWNRESKEFGC